MKNLMGGRGGNRGGFTLIELLISIALLSLVLLALYHSLDIMRASNAQLFKYLKSSQDEKRSVEILYLDIAGTSGKITIENEDFSRLCIEKTVNSLYGLTHPMVCWLVTKSENTLIRSEGGDYKIPLEGEPRVAVDKVLPNIELFRAYKGKSSIVVVLRQKGKEAISFLVQGLPEEQKGKGNPNGINLVPDPSNPGVNPNTPNPYIPQPPPNAPGNHPKYMDLPPA